MELAEAKAGGADEGANARAEALLEVNGVTIRFGGVTALQDVSFEVARGAVQLRDPPSARGTRVRSSRNSSEPASTG
jgi:hypothetical protein